jgi:hypothetical protein
MVPLSYVRLSIAVFVVDGFGHDFVLTANEAYRAPVKKQANKYGDEDDGRLAERKR